MNTHVPSAVPDEEMHGINIIYPNQEGEGSHVAYFLALPEQVDNHTVARMATDLINRAYEAGKAEMFAAEEAAITEIPDVDGLRRENAALREQVQDLDAGLTEARADTARFRQDAEQAREQLERMEPDLTRSRAEYNSAVQSRNQWRDDFAVVAQAILEECERRDWCSEYDDFVRVVNGRLRNGELLVREYDVDGEVNFKFRFTRSHSDRSAEDQLSSIGEAVASYLRNNHSEYDLYDWDVHSVEETRAES